ncbi:MAG: mandelate racemase/muconate lactonizing enzyme family protein [Trueperaceae bacterium]|nr:mandelate racemase/muconate lactonizing enzyme family protein [Trueperaceae bacterium]
MRIRKVETQIVDIPFVDGGKGEGITPTTWNRLEILLVRVEDDDGNVGWGEGFGYFVVDASKAIVDRMIAPLLEGSVVDDIPAWNLANQRRLHLFGRYGVTLFAISAVDIALWDLAAKRRGLPLYRLLGSESARDVPFYASLVRYADTRIAPAVCERALRMGFSDLKLHEITVPDVAACRAAVGREVPISVDVNCAWGEDEARATLAPLAELGIAWLEEPVFPPEDLGALARLRGTGVPIAAGENWCTSVQFAAATAAGAVDLAQPSVTKVGGISEFLAVAEVCRAAGVPLMPHCPYYGPGFHASLHLATAVPEVVQLEYLLVEPDAWLAPVGKPGPGGTFRASETPGTGFEPDLDVLQRYRRA